MSEAITGTCTEISERSGWHTFHIDKGSQYPVKLATKKEEVIAAAREAGGHLAVWTYNEVESDKINEHTGKPFVNRYLESVEVGGTMPPQASAPSSTPVSQTVATSPSSVASHAPLPPGDKDRAITRMAVLKAAAEACCSGMDYAPGEDVAAVVISVAARFETWVYRDVDDVPF